MSPIHSFYDSGSLVWWSQDHLSAFDDAVLLASSGDHFQLTPGQFAAECEHLASLNLRAWFSAGHGWSAHSGQKGGVAVPSGRVFEYLGVSFTSEGRMEQIGAASAAMQTLHLAAVAKTVDLISHLHIGPQAVCSSQESNWMSGKMQHRVELLLLCVQRSQLKWFVLLIRRHSGRLIGDVSQY